MFKKPNYYNKKSNNSKQTSSSSHSTKSTAYNKKCINSVFEKWIQDWRDDAVAKDLQSKHTYTKCLNSLRKYPLPLNTGKECVILEGFGDKICKSIDEKLKSFLDDGGILHEVDLLNSSSDSSCEEAVTITKKTTNKTSAKSRQVTVVDVDDDNDLISVEKEYTSNIVLNSKATNSIINIGEKNKATNDSDHEKQNASKRAKTTGGSSGKKSYIPEFRSGPYALLVALFENETESSDSDFMLKKDLIKEAQKHCDSSFTSTDPNSHYSAWNSMSSLVKKNLVIKENKLPARYKLTEEGRNLATTILYGAKENENEPSFQKAVTNESRKKSPQKKTPSIPDKQANRVEYVIKERETELIDETSSKKTSSKEDIVEILSDSDSDIITISEAPVIASKPTTSKSIPKKSVFINKNISDSDSDDSLPDIGMEFSSKFTYKEKSPIKTTQTKTLLKTTSFNSSQQATSYSSQISSTGLTQQIETISASNTSKYASKFSESSFLKKTNGPTPSVLYSFAPGTYDIMLFVDNCEQSHAKRQDILIDELKKSKIKFDIGKLNVGDFTWIARSKNARNDDIILNFIVERKRMDDFCQSIIDGRYKEQKFRIKKCGITKVIYLIEEFGSIKHMSLPEKSKILKIYYFKSNLLNLLNLKKDVNTQLIDHLIVHHTTDPKDSAHYLIEMTNFIAKSFQNLTLNACAKDQIDDFNKSNQSTTYLMQFQEFNKFSNKNKPLTIKEMFAKCLMKIQGVSQEKCIAIIDLYPTPKALFKEYSKCPDDSKREKLLANLKYGTQQRNIGPAISKLIAQLFYSSGPLN